MNTTGMNAAVTARAPRAALLRRRLAQLAVLAAVLSVLAAVFLLYQHPDLAFDVANKLWTCL